MAVLGVHTFAVAEQWTAREAEHYLPRLAEFGATLIEIPLLRPTELDTAASTRVLEKHHMQASCSLGLPDHFDVVNRESEALDFLQTALQVAREVGADALSGVTYGSIGKTSGQPPSQRELDAITSLLDKAAAFAATLNMKLGIEPCNRYETHLLNTAADCRQLIERTGRDNLMIHLDSYHMNIEEQSISRGLADASPFLGYVHASESNRGVPGSGTVDWPDFMQGLKAVEFNGPVVLESFNHMHPDIASGLAVWKPVASRPDDVIEVGLPRLRQFAADAGYEFVSRCAQ